MQFYTRLFHDTRVPYFLLDEAITVYEEAESYSEELYQRLTAEREEELKEISWSREVHAFSGGYTVGSMELLRDIPHTDIADMRVFLLGGVSASVMKRLREGQKKQAEEWAALKEKVEERKRLDEKRMPAHWLPLLEADWFDGFVEWMTEGDKVLSAVAHFSDRRMCKMKFRNARIWREVENEFGTINLFAEVLWEEGKLRLNILTHTNEFSVLAEDVELEWAEEDFACMERRKELLG